MCRFPAVSLFHHPPPALSPLPSPFPELWHPEGLPKPAHQNPAYSSTADDPSAFLGTWPSLLTKSVSQVKTCHLKGREEPQFWRLWCPMSRRWQIPSLVRTLSQVWRRVPSHCGLTWPLLAVLFFWGGKLSLFFCRTLDPSRWIFCCRHNHVILKSDRHLDLENQVQS